jgi:hypothetical protein
LNDRQSQALYYASIQRLKSELLYKIRKKIISDYNIINTFQKINLYLFNSSIIFEKLRSRFIISSNIIIIINIFGNRVKITINHSITAKKIDIIIKKN